MPRHSLLSLLCDAAAAPISVHNAAPDCTQSHLGDVLPLAVHGTLLAGAAQIYSADAPAELPSHLVLYPYEITRDGNASPPQPGHTGVHGGRVVCCPLCAVRHTLVVWCALYGLCCVVARWDSKLLSPCGDH